MTGPVRVLQVLGSSAGGVARHVRQLGEALSAPMPDGPGWAVLVAGPSEVADEVAPPAGPVAFRPVEIADRPRLADLAAVRRLRALAVGADVVHAHGLRAGALTVLATRTVTSGRRPRVVVTLHNLPVGGWRVGAVSGVLESVVARGSDVVLGVSGDLVTRARARGATAAERALVPAPPRRADVADPAVTRSALGVGPAQRLLVTVARLAPQKGLDTLLGAAGRLVDPPADEHGESSAGWGDRLVWVLAGDGPLRDALAARIARESLPVRLLGRRGDVPDLLGAADVVVSTAVWEGQPIAVQEALGLGAAVVATDAGGTREVTGDHGAVLVPVGDATAVAGAIRALLDDDERRQRQRAAARRRADELPDVAAVVDQLRRVYGR